VFLDVVMGGLPGPPVPGQEIWAADRAVSPGGIANNAVGAARLGLRTGLAAAIGDDECGDLVWRALSQEPNLDLAWSRRVPGLRTALTVSLTCSSPDSPAAASAGNQAGNQAGGQAGGQAGNQAGNQDRALVSHGVLDPLPMEDLVRTVPRARASFLSLSTGAELPGWLHEQRKAGALVFADVGWDERYGWSREVLGQLSGVDVFVPNEAEAMAYTGTSTVRDALYALGEFVPLTVITRGRDGAIALDAATGTEVSAEAISKTHGRDSTGAGDSFVAGLMAATLAGESLLNRVRFGCVCAGLSVRKLGGAASAPTVEDILTWLAGAPPEYGFIRDLLHPQKTGEVSEKR
jgi:sugar/nucleoside kinase (ribokinase family)